VEVFITPQARADLDRIYAYIEQDNPTRAITFVREIGRRCLLLKDMPLRFQLVPGHELTGIRRMPHGNYAVYYQVGENIVSILHVLNTAQDHEAVLFPDTETP
jgi:plasmid stabilization system protein ParE